MHVVGRDVLTIEAKISGGAGVAGNGAIKTQIKGSPDGGINTHAGHHTAQQELGDVCRFQMIKQIGFTEAVGVVFGDYCLIRQRRDGLIDLYARCIRKEEG